MRGFRHHCLIVAAALALLGAPGAAWADCTSPAAPESWTRYDFTAHTLYLCNGTNWLSMAGGSSSGTAGYIQFSNGSGGFSNSGTTADQQLFWDNTNKRLGIGTAAPGGTLHVYGANAPVGLFERVTSVTGSERGALVVKTTTTGGSTDNNFGTAISFFGQNGSGGAENQYAAFLAARDGADNSGKIKLRTFNAGVGVDAIIIGANGNVGIGTTSPGAKLDVQSSSYSYVRSKGFDNSTAAAAGGFLAGRSRSATVGTSAHPLSSDRIGFFTGTSDNGGTTAFATMDIMATENHTDTAKGMALAFRTTANGGVTSSERLRIDHNGNVGIGTAVPTKPLHIYNTTWAEARIEGSGANAGSSLSVYGDETSSNIIRMRTKNDGSKFWDVSTNGDAYAASPSTQNDFFIGQFNNSVWTSRFVIDSATGDVGIGTSSPAQKLDVVGSAAVSGTLGIGTTSPSETLHVAGGGRAFIGESGASRRGLLIAAGTLEMGAPTPYARIEAFNYGTTLGIPLSINPAGGNVGIGTASPADRLQVVGGITSGTPGSSSDQFTAFNLITKNGNTLGLQNASSKGWTLYGRGDAYNNGSAVEQNDFGLSYWSGSTWRVSLVADSATGNVGIGTTSPTRNLDVASNGSTGINIAAGSTGQWAELTLKNSNTTANAKIWGIANSGTSNTLQFRTLDDDNSSNPSVKMLIDRSGNVGIGTTIPGYLLDVRGSTSGTTNARFGGSKPIFLASSDPTVAFGAYFNGGWKYSDTGAYAAYITQTSSTGTLSLNVTGATGTADAAASFTSALAITKDGNVGIGTAIPSYRLHVNETKTDTSAGNAVMSRDDLNVNPSANSATTFIARMQRADIPSGNGFNITGAINSSSNYTTHTGTGTVAVAYGSSSLVDNLSATGVITQATGASNGARGNSAGTITAGYGASNIAHTMNAASNMTSGYGAYNAAQTTSGTMTNGFGSYDAVVHNAPTTMAVARGSVSSISVGSGATVTAAYGLYTGLSNAGTVASWYGLYVPASTGTAPTTNRYPVYVVDTGSNYFAGNVGIGTTTPAAKLDVNGFMRLAKNGSAPATCDATIDGAVALTSARRMCVCDATSWKEVNSATACTW